MDRHHHFGVVLFVVGRLLTVLAGNWLGWRWVNHLWFRLAHLVAIAVVVVQSWLGQYCPLTTLESWLRVKAGQSAYKQSFVEHWLQRLIYYEAPFSVFTLADTSFPALVLFVWWLYPPRRRSDKGSDAQPFAQARLPPARHLARVALAVIIRLAGQVPSWRRPSAQTLGRTLGAVAGWKYIAAREGAVSFVWLKAQDET